MLRRARSGAVLVVGLVIALLAAACGPGEGADESAAGSAEAGAAGELSGSISFMHWWAYVDEETIAPFLEAHPGVEVDMQFVPPGDPYFTRIRTLAASSDLPDVFGIQGTPFTSLIEGDRLLELSEALQTPAYGSEMSWGETFEPVLLENVAARLPAELTPEGEQWGVPFGAVALSNVYNAEIFEEVGIEEPATWDEYLANCRALDEAGYIPQSLVGEIWGGWWPSIAWDQTMRDVTQEDFLSGEVTLQDERIVEGLRIVEELVEAGCFSPAGTTNGIDETQTLFVQGELAQFLTVPENFAQYLVENSPFEVGSYSLPPAAGVEPARTLGGAANTLVINANSDNTELALEFAKFMTSDIVFESLIDDYVIPSVTTVELAPEDNPVLQGFIDAAERGFANEGRLPAFTPEGEQEWQDNVLPRLFRGEIGAEQAAQRLAEILGSSQ